MGNLSHFDETGAGRMVDTSQKDDTVRIARASGKVRMRPETLSLIVNKSLAKGDVFEVARLAGIMAAKQTSNLIPLCHPLPITSAKVNFQPLDPGTVSIEAIVKCVGKTGVEMEALTAVSISALTIYDMCKAVDKDIVIEQIQLEEKEGGKTGHYVRPG